MIKKILFTIYTGGYPTEDSGGPNNIIYKMIKHNKEKFIEFGYLSSDLYVKNIKKFDILNAKQILSPKKKLASLAYKNSNLYRALFGSDFYLPYHFYKKNNYYKSYLSYLKRYDILHSHDSIALGLLFNRDKSQKRILTVHSKGPLSSELKKMPKSKSLADKIEYRLKSIERKSVKIADLIIFPSKAARNYFENNLEMVLPSEKIKIIYNGVDIQLIKNTECKKEIFQNYSIDFSRKLIILNVAAHTSEKNIDILIDVAKHYIKTYDDKILFINIGEINTSKTYIKRVEKFGLQNNFLFLGSIPNKDVISFLKVSDIFIMTSTKVIFDLVVIEALASGICCIVSNEGGNKEIIRDNDNGYLIDINNIKQISEKIRFCEKNNVKKRAIETANDYSIEKMVSEYISVYKEII